MAPETSILASRAALLGAPDIVPLTTDQVATATGLSRNTLLRWACYRTPGKLLPFTKRGGRNLYLPADVRGWLGIGAGE